MASALVVKVQCGDTLRRFNTYIGENGKLVLSMEQLKEKIRSLFNLAADNDFSLTYTDTDGDTVTLVEDCDLVDVVSQRLNPIRMVVNLKTVNKGGHSNVKASGNSTPMESPRVQQSIENIQAGVEEVVNTVPEPLRGVLSKLIRDLAYTASAPVIADIIHSVANIANHLPVRDLKRLLRRSRLVKTKLVKAKADLVCLVRKVAELLRFAAATAASNSTGKRDPRCPMLANAGSSNLNVNPFNECLFSGTQVDARFPASYKGDRGSLFKRSPGHFDSVDSVFHAGVECDVCGVHPITGPRFKSKVRYNYDLCSLCYEKSGNEADYVRIDTPFFYLVPGHDFIAVARPRVGRKDIVDEIHSKKPMMTRQLVDLPQNKQFMSTPNESTLKNI
uniref:ZZ-type domain-containing protein n=1 Tax=Kalanchoe fedtschenkoi TaxID=63787 RepID=A0A7N0TIZ8_KALFE